jgi:hypothetical protein
MPTTIKLTQYKRQIAIETPLGKEVLLLNRFALRERLSEPFEIEAELSSLKNRSIKCQGTGTLADVLNLTKNKRLNYVIP